MSNQQDEAKKVAGRRVIQDFIHDGMKLGLVLERHRIFLFESWVHTSENMD